MREVWVIRAVFAVGFLLFGCMPVKTPSGEEMRHQPEAIIMETPTSPPPTVQTFPYPAVGQEMQIVSQEAQAYPPVTDEVATKSPTPIVNQTPTPHVDIILRATDPDAFVLAAGKYQMVEFFAFWCPTCKSLAPVLKNLENKYKGKIQFIYLDIDDPKTNPFKQALGYQYQPHLFLIDGEGKVLMQWVGYVAEEELDAVLSSLQ